MGSLVTLSRDEIEAIAQGRHGDPFAVLGVFGAKTPYLARALVPGAETLEAFTLAGKSAGVLTRVHDRGVFEGQVALAAERSGGLRTLTVSARC